MLYKAVTHYKTGVLGISKHSVSVNIEHYIEAENFVDAHKKMHGYMATLDPTENELISIERIKGDLIK